jgi:hypothetical protein
VNRDVFQKATAPLPNSMWFPDRPRCLNRLPNKVNQNSSIFHDQMSGLSHKSLTAADALPGDLRQALEAITSAS